MAKKKTLKYWKTKIDKVFHEYIRRRDADNNTGYCNCISCNKPIHYTESDAGEYSFNVGIELAQELLFTSRQTFKLMEHEYQELFEKFRDKLADLKSQQNF